MKKIEFKVDIQCEKKKNEVLKRVAKLPGINELKLDDEKGILTVIGLVDPVKIAKKLRKCGAYGELISVGPPKKPEEKKDGKDDKKKDKICPCCQCKKCQPPCPPCCQCKKCQPPCPPSCQCKKCQPLALCYVSCEMPCPPSRQCNQCRPFAACYARSYDYSPCDTGGCSFL